MDPNKNFTEEDKKSVVNFLNYIAKHAEFTHKTDGVIEYFKLLSFMQQKLIPKIDANILEVVRVVETKDDDSGESK